MTEPAGETTALDQLRQKLGREWPAIARADRAAQAMRAQLRGALRNLDSVDTSIVVFGSLARNEWTSKSDLDWTLLIDGQADPEHLTATQRISDRLAALDIPKPGRGGVFGKMAFSHDIIHRIGGQDDTNQNTTQRILLLLESRAIDRDEAYDRVITQILHRYLLDDRGLIYGGGKYKVPRFLLNDIVRFWRTMTVDFVYKQREHAGEAWALRDAKLRLSRKLIFVSGLLLCFHCHLEMPAEIRRSLSENSIPVLVDHLKKDVQSTPLEIVAAALLSSRASGQTARNLLDAYDAFLAMLDDPQKRGRLKELRWEDLHADPTFREMLEISHQFQGALSKLFFEEDPDLFDLIKFYGVF